MKIIFLIIAIYFTIVNTGRVCENMDISPLNILLQTIGIVGFVALQFNLI